MTTMVIENKKTRADFRAKIQATEDLVPPRLGDWQANRAAIFRKLAEVKKRIEARDEMRAYVRRLEDEQDSAVAQHAEKTAPLQAQLAGDLPPAERIEIRRQVDAVNAEFEPIFETFRQQIGAASRELGTLTLACNSFQPLQNSLTKPENCDPALDEERHCCERAEFWAHRWLNEAQDHLEKMEAYIATEAESRLRERPNKAVQISRELERNLRLAKVQVSAAQHHVSSLQQRKQEIFEKMISE